MSALKSTWIAFAAVSVLVLVAAPVDAQGCAVCVDHHEHYELHELVLNPAAILGSIDTPHDWVAGDCASAGHPEIYPCNIAASESLDVPLAELRDLPASELAAAIAKSGGRVFVNHERMALQVLGCSGDEIAAHFPLRFEQYAALAAILDAGALADDD